MKQLKDEVALVGPAYETITMTELRKSPGQVMAMVALGKTYLIAKAGKPVAVLSRPPGATLAMVVANDGSVTYRP